MDTEFFFYFVTALSVLYAIAIRLVQGKIVNKELMKEVQDKSKRINELYKEAAKTNDKRKMDEIEKINNELMPKMNTMMFNQMKTMAAILIVFFTFTQISTFFDPTQTDDITINLTKTGDNYAGVLLLPDAKPGFWYVTVKAYDGANEIASNQTVFFTGEKTEQIIWIHNTGSPLSVQSDKEVYQNGETVNLAVNAQPATRATATFNSGTRFYVDLPVTIPLINLRRIYDSQSWFIFSAVLIGLLINPLVSLMEKHMPKGMTIKI